MSDNNKIQPTHLARLALVYVRQSTTSQLERNQESTDRQYKLVERAIELGWSRDQITIIDEDLGCTGSGLVERIGFEKMASEVALGRVGIILGLEVSRLARNNADWYRLLDLAGMTDTLIADADGLYHAGLFNDRLVLGLKGTMSEAELHLIRARLIGGIRNKAARGELRLGLPIGFVWGDCDGEIKFHPNEAVVGAIRNVFDRFAEMGSARQVWLWFRSQNLPFPNRSNGFQEIRWVTATYSKIHEVLTNPVYAGAYIYGKTRSERYVDTTGRIRNRMRHLPQAQWRTFIKDHHEGFIDWQTYESNQARIGCNTRPRPHEAGGAVREGVALLQGIATCGQCGRRLHVHYQGKNSSPGYHCPGSILVEGRSMWCLRVGGVQIDEAVVKAFLEAVKPAGIEAAIVAETSIESDYDAAIAQWLLEVERARYEAQRAERRYQAVEPENRLVARGLEVEWEKCLRNLAAAEAELVSRENMRPRLLTTEDKEKLHALGTDISKVWTAPTTTDRDRKELLRTVLEEVITKIERKSSSPTAHLTLRWRGGAITDLDLELKHRHQPKLRTDEDTIDLVRRLATHYPDPVIAGILNRQDRHTATGERFTANKVGCLRRYWKIPKFEQVSMRAKGELATIDKAAEMLGVAPSTVHRWLAEGFIAGEQLTPGAPWRIRMTKDLRKRFVEQEIKGYVPMINATKILGVTRQTIMQRIKRGELQAVHIIRGKRKGLRIKVSQTKDTTSKQLSFF
jgi:DNA invertase Pin-like site-specific DNA recombinase